MLAIVLSFSVVSHAEAANRYWAGGASDRWELSTNWASVPKGAGGAGVPGAADTAILNNSGSSIRFATSSSYARFGDEPVAAQSNRPGRWRIWSATQSAALSLIAS